MYAASGACVRNGGASAPNNAGDNAASRRIFYSSQCADEGKKTASSTEKEESEVNEEGEGTGRNLTRD